MRWLCTVSQLFARCHRDIKTYRIDQFYRPHRHPESKHGFVDSFR